MRFSLCRAVGLVGVCLATSVLAATCAAPCWAITAGYVDDFDDQDLHGWRIGTPGDFPRIVLDVGPTGVGDHSLHFATAGAGGEHPRLIVFNDTPLNDGNWEGNWTAAGITQIAADVRNPNEFTLNLRLGIVGPGGAFGGGQGDTYVTQAIDVAPNPGGWQRVVFDVLVADWLPASETADDPVAALAGVTQFRFLHNPALAFVGEELAGELYLDNITAIAAPVGVLGDYNGNGIVDAADYVVWRDSPPSLVNEGASLGVVDQADYDFWRQRFGANSAVGSATGSGASNAVPEPASWLSMTGLLMMAWIQVRRRV